MVCDAIAFHVQFYRLPHRQVFVAYLYYLNCPGGKKENLITYVYRLRCLQNKARRLREDINARLFLMCLYRHTLVNIPQAQTLGRIVYWYVCQSVLPSISTFVYSSVPLAIRPFLRPVVRISLYPSVCLYARNM